MSWMINYREEFYNSLLRQLKVQLGEQKITQVQVGQALGLKQSAVSSLLSGKSRMTLDQFFILSELIGALPQSMLQKAGSSVNRVVNLNQVQEDTLYKSETHLLCYCAAIKPIAAHELKVVGVGAQEVKRSFEDLVRAELLVFRNNKYVQSDARVIYQPSSRLKGSASHQRISIRSWQYFDHKYSDKNFIQDKFNAFDVDLYTATQIKELNSALWKVYERMQTIKQANLAAGYEHDEPMTLWNLHMMLMTPVEIKYS